MRDRRGAVNVVVGVVLSLGASLAGAGCGAVPLAQYATRRVVREATGIRYDGFVAEPLGERLTRYARLEVVPLDNQMEDLIPAELVTGLNEQLFQQLQRAERLEVARGDRARPRIAPGAGGPAPAPPRRAGSVAADSTPTVVLDAAIVDFDPGNQAQRLLQFGVGRQAVLTLHLRFVDGATGERLGKYIINSEVYRLGTDPEAMVDRLSAGIGELVLALIEASRPAAGRNAAA